jgi:hypothetical protein
MDPQQGQRDGVDTESEAARMGHIAGGRLDPEWLSTLVP